MIFLRVHSNGSLIFPTNRRLWGRCVTLATFALSCCDQLRSLYSLVPCVPTFSWNISQTPVAGHSSNSNNNNDDLYKLNGRLVSYPIPSGVVLHSWMDFLKGVCDIIIYNGNKSKWRFRRAVPIFLWTAATQRDEVCWIPKGLSTFPG